MQHKRSSLLYWVLCCSGAKTQRDVGREGSYSSLAYLCACSTLLTSYNTPCSPVASVSQSHQTCHGLGVPAFMHSLHRTSLFKACWVGSTRATRGVRLMECPLQFAAISSVFSSLWPHSGITNMEPSLLVFLLSVTDSSSVHKKSYH